MLEGALKDDQALGDEVTELPFRKPSRNLAQARWITPLLARLQQPRIPPRIRCLPWRRAARSSF